MSARFVRRNARRILGVAVVAVLFAALRAPGATHAERAAVAARFRLARRPLPEVPGPEVRAVRVTHPSLRRIPSFMSTMGTSVALHDLDGDGLPNDLCRVDARTDQVIVEPVPGTGARYAPFALRQEPRVPDPRATPAMGCMPADLNEDGHADLVVYYAGRTPLAWLWAGGAYVPRELVPGGGGWVTGAAVFADFDGDGHGDLLFANYFADGSRIYDPRAGGTVEMPGSFSRADNGGGERVLRWTGARAGSDPDVAFAEEPGAIPADVRGGWGLAAAAADLDGDLLPELYVAHDFGPDRLFHNLSTPGRIRFATLTGRLGFAMPRSRVLGRDSFKGMGVDMADLNGDGIPDIVVSNITEEFAGQESQLAFLSTGRSAEMRSGVAPYEDRGEELGLARSGWSWDVRLADLDNDGVLEEVQATGFFRGTVNRWPEIQELGMANDALIPTLRASWPALRPGDDVSGHDQNALFARIGGRYVNVAREVGFGEPYASRGIALGDVDGDGDLDLAVANLWGPSTFYANECARCGAFLGLRLLLPPAQSPGPTRVVAGLARTGLVGRPAVGAQATVRPGRGPALSAQVDGGSGHSGKRSPELHFGLGEYAGPVQVSLRWRDAGGRPRAETLRLTPGWHTILLASGGSR